LANSIAAGDVQALRFFHLGQQCRRELYIVTVATSFLDRFTLVLEKALTISDVPIRFGETLF
jgi:hypothetical protein